MPVPASARIGWSGGLPLIDQPGERLRYGTGAAVAGILVERVTGAPLAEVCSPSGR